MTKKIDYWKWVSSGDIGGSNHYDNVSENPILSKQLLDRKSKSWNVLCTGRQRLTRGARLASRQPLCVGDANVARSNPGRLPVRNFALLQRQQHPVLQRAQVGSGASPAGFEPGRVLPQRPWRLPRLQPLVGERRHLNVVVTKRTSVPSSFQIISSSCQVVNSKQDSISQTFSFQPTVKFKNRFIFSRASIFQCFCRQLYFSIIDGTSCFSLRRISNKATFDENCCGFLLWPQRSEGLERMEHSHKVTLKGSDQ